MTTTEIPATALDIPTAMPTRMTAPEFYEIEALEADSSATLLLAQRVAAAIDAPATPADDPDTITMRSANALAAVWALAAEACDAVLPVHDRNNTLWLVHFSADSDHRPGLYAHHPGAQTVSINDLMMTAGPVRAPARHLTRPAEPGPHVELAGQVQWLLHSHGIRVTATPDEDAVIIWPEAGYTTLDAAWVERIRAILEPHHLTVTTAQQRIDGCTRIVEALVRRAAEEIQR